MGILDNIGDQLDNQFENSNFLPQGLFLEDFDKNMKDFYEKMNLTVEVDGKDRKVPVHWLNKELWAERQQGWWNMGAEKGEEFSKPFMGIVRTGVKQGTSPLKRTIPVKKKFSYVKVPTFDGTLKGYDIYKIPQPSWVDISYELRLVSSYMIDVNAFYEKVIRDNYSDRQGYMIVNGHQIRSVIGDPTEDNQMDIDDERIYQVTIPVTVYGKLLDPEDYEMFPAIKKIMVKLCELKKK
jgi:hypothetical protein